MGVLAGLPYSFSSTEMGLLFIGWSGINELQKPHKQQQQEAEQAQAQQQTQPQSQAQTPNQQPSANP
jgi:flagellar biosynthesis component FlhA